MTFRSNLPSCPAAIAGRELAHTLTRLTRFDEARDPAHGATESLLWSRVETLERQVAESPAQSAEGAVYQALVIAGCLDRFSEVFDPEADPERAEAMRRQELCVYSLLRFLHAEAGTHTPESVAGWYLCAGRDPFGALPLEGEGEA